MPVKTAKNGKPKVEADGSGPIPKAVRDIINFRVGGADISSVDDKKALLKYINGLRKQIPAAS